MFRIKKHDEPIKWPVKVNVPQDNGVVKKQTFHALFQLLPQKDAAALIDEGDEAFLMAITKGLEGVQDENGDEAVYSAELVERLVNISYVKTAMIGAYFEMLAGVGRKN